MPAVQRTVTDRGISWSILSQAERCCAHGGRFFYARRSRSQGTWNLYEHDSDILKGPVKPLGRVVHSPTNARSLTQVVLALLDGRPVQMTSKSTVRVRMTLCPFCKAEQPRERRNPQDELHVQPCRHCHLMFQPELGRLITSEAQPFKPSRTDTERLDWCLEDNAARYFRNDDGTFCVMAYSAGELRWAGRKSYREAIDAFLDGDTLPARP